MRKRTRYLAASGAVALCIGAVGIATSAAGPQGGIPGVVFDVTVTNMTRGQIFSPVLAAVHDDSVSLFEPGEAASAELATLAEDGDATPLATLLSSTTGVHDVAVGSGMVMPGQSVTVQVTAQGNARFLSVASMLVSTNDSFLGLRSLRLRHGAVETTEVAVPAYDAGSEANSESCAFVPGPPCGSGGMHDPAPAEGFVHVSAGIHGIADLVPAEHGWHNPVALVTVRRAN